MSGKLIPSAKGRFYPIKPDQGPWLIWSYKWSLWHRRSSTGGAAGYTDDIVGAGVFDLATASAYHDRPPHRTDVAIPAAKAIDEMKRRADKMTADAERIYTLADTLATVRTALKMSEGEG